MVDDSNDGAIREGEPPNASNVSRREQVADAETEIIRLLTELRDLQREELAYRRRVLDKSMAAQQEGLSLQEIGLERAKQSLERQEEAIRVHRLAIGATVLLIVVLGIIAFALLSK